ncbi:transposase [Streptomyces sp. NPDC054783]
MSLTDAHWARIEPLLPDRKPKRGGRWRDHREVIDAIAFKFRTGTQWVHLPEKYGNWRGVYNRLRMWAVDGTWERVFAALMAQADADKELDCDRRAFGRAGVELDDPGPFPSKSASFDRVQERVRRQRTPSANRIRRTCCDRS